MAEIISRFGQVAGAMANQDGLASRSQLHALGVPDRTINRWANEGGIERLARHVFHLPNQPWTWETKLTAALLIGGPGAAVGFRSATALWELDGSRRTTTEITAELNAVRPHPLYVRRETRNLPALDLTSLRGMRITTPIRTLIDVARFVPEQRLAQMVDDAHRRDLLTFDDLAQRFCELATRGRTGVPKLRRVLSLRSPLIGPAANTFEQEFERLVEGAGFPPPVRQYTINVDGYSYYVDHAWPDFGGGSECDSMLAHSTPSQLNADLERQNRITDSGFWLKRFTYHHVTQNQRYVIGELAKKLPRGARR